MSTTDSTATTAAPPAAWYPDPTGRHHLRWWDGAGWTQRVAEDPTAVTPPEPVEAEAEAADHGPVETEHELFVPLENGLGAAPLVADDDGAIEAAATEHEGGDPMVGFDQLKPSRLPPAERASTGAGLSASPNRKVLLAMIGVLLVVGAALAWGYANYESADRWRDRGEALQEELDTRASNADAFEEALNQSASRRARLADSQQQMAQLRDATEATVTQIDSCAAALNDLLNVAAGGSDPTTAIDRANEVCSQAAVNGEELIRVLDALQEA